MGSILLLLEVSGSPTVVIVVVRTVVRPRCETAAPPLPHTRRSCADALLVTIKEIVGPVPGEDFQYLWIGLKSLSSPVAAVALESCLGGACHATCRDHFRMNPGDACVAPLLAGVSDR